MYINISKVDFGKYYRGGGGVTPEPGEDYLCFTSTGDSTVAMTQNGTPSTSANKVIQYKLNDGQWQNWDLSAVTLSDGDKMYVKSYNEIPMSEADSICKQFVMTGSIAASGNIMSLLNFSDTLPDYAFYSLFKECTSLTQAPTLPATTLANYCYSEMFYNCTSLTTTPALPATTLGQDCYARMFYNCTSLTTAPALPATTLAINCYDSMFNSCTSLTTAPELPATTLAVNCYSGMFAYCSSLVQAPELPATTLDVSCYTSMFTACTSLTTAPALPATTLVMFCYGSMFAWCSSLVQAPELPATTLEYSCYNYMFQGCSKLNYVKALFTNADQNNLDGWLNNVSPTGTFIKSKDATWTNEQAGIPTGWTVQVEGGVTPEPEPERDYLCFTSTGDSTVAMTQHGTPDTSANKVIQYKLNSGQWQTWDLSAVTLADGDKMYVKSDDEIPISEPSYIYKKFVMTGSIAASGNIMSLLNFSTTLTDFAFYALFSSCTSLTQAPELPTTTLAQNCYKEMFYGCTSLVTAPALPATTLTYGCYISMLEKCTSLVQAPELPATTLAERCYEYMFNKCNNLNYVKAMFTNIIDNALVNWLNNVSPTGTFIKSKDATWTNEQAGIPTGWTVQVEGGVTPEPEPAKDYLCFTSTGDSTVAMTQNGTPNTSANKVIQYKLNDGQWQNWDLSAVTLHDADKMYLKSDDEIQMSESYSIYKNFVMSGSIAASGNIMSLLNFSTTLTENSFYMLFYNCTSLTTAPELPATNLTTACYSGMFNGCTSLTTTPELPATTLATNCYASMFNNCTSLVTAPELHATTLIDGCYRSMFSGCTSLTQAPALQATNIAQNCYKTMFKGCTSLTTAPELPATTLAESCYQGMFYGCSSLTTAPELPATTLTKSCYESMFTYCTSLVQAPALPATTLVDRCYNAMFFSCTALTTAPELPATTLVITGYNSMFKECSKLNYVKAMFTEVPTANYLGYWLTNVSPTGTFVKNSAATWTNEQAEIPRGWTVQTASPDK